MTTYPQGYGTALVSLDRLRELYVPKMHPEYARRLFPFIESQGGQIGIGSGWRKQNPPNTPGFAPPGRSFHEYQDFTGGPRAYAAVDLVARNPGRVHRAPWTSECPQQGSQWAIDTGVHTNVGVPGQSGYESWHMQPIELDGWGSWNNAGKPDLQYNYPIAGAPEPEPEPEPEPTPEEIMASGRTCIVKTTARLPGGAEPAWILVDGGSVRQVNGAVDLSANGTPEYEAVFGDAEMPPVPPTAMLNGTDYNFFAVRAGVDTV